MDVQLFQQAAAIFEDVRDEPDDARSRRLEELCAGDSALRREVESLLRHHDRGGDELDTPLSLHLRSTRAEQILPADAIHGYRILRLIGEGGMGVVYLAQQVKPARTVALKLMRPEIGIGAPALQRRLEREADLLARLQHPGIAQVYEAGTTQVAGRPQPFFAMEYVEGERLLEYAEAHTLDARQRLALVAEICDAVQHAHERGVIHRDLKPANILVGADGRPRVLDFGVARALGADPEQTLLTQSHQLVGTLAYMSPEQLGGGQDLDGRCDVYALGVVAFELLTGDGPYEIRGKNPAEAARIIRDEEPSALSSHSRHLRGDIQTIVSRALEKEPQRRYQSAAALAADIRRYLRDEPIVARPPSSLYQLRKFARRNRGLVGGIAASFVVLLLGATGTSVGMVQARAYAADTSEALNAADRQKRIAQAVNHFLTTDLLAQADPFSQPQRGITLREVLDRAAGEMEQRFVREPLVEAAIRMTMAQTYMGLGEYATAEEQTLRALELRRGELGEDDPETLAAMGLLGTLCWHQADYDEAIALHRQTLKRRTAVLGPEHPDTLTSLHGLAVCLKSSGDYDAAYPLLTQVVELRERLLGTDSPASIISRNALASYLLDQGAFDEAERMYIENLEASRRLLGEAHPDTITAMNNLGRVYQESGRYDQAGPYFEEALALRRQILGDEHPMTVASINNLGLLYDQLERFEDAEPLLREALEVRRRTLASDHPDVLLSMHNLAGSYLRQGRYELAEPLFVETLEMCQQTLGPDSRDTLITQTALGVLYSRSDRPELAEPLFRDIVTRFRATLPEGHWFLGSALSNHGSSLTKLQHFAEAESNLLEAYELLSAGLGEEHARTRNAAARLIDLYEAWQRPRDAEAWRPRAANDAAAGGG